MPAMIEITNAEKAFTMHLQGGVKLPVVRGVNFVVNAGECIVLSGPSGAGKSSILKMMFGNYRCDGGRIGIRHRGALIDLAQAEPRLVFMDEPTGGLDVSVQARLLDLMRNLVGELGLAAIVVTHDLAVARLLSHRVMVMKGGEVIETGLTDQVLDDPHEPYTQLLVSSILPP